MAIGPVQLIALGFRSPDFHGEIIAELERLRQSDMVRVIDSLAVYKDAAGGIEIEHLSNLTEDEAVELGSKIGALIGLGVDGEEGAAAGAAAGAGAGGRGIGGVSGGGARGVPTASRCFRRRPPGTCSTTSPMTRPPHSSCWSTTGRWDSGTRSCGPE